MKKKQMLTVLLMAMMSVSAVACSDNNSVQTLAEQEQEKEDLTQFEGNWNGDGEYDYVTFDGKGNWELYSADQMAYSGTMEYVQKDDCYYVYTTQDGAEQQCQMNEDGTITFEVYGTFTKAGQEKQEPTVITMNSFNYYFDMWYKDGSLDEVCVLLDETGTWEVYDAMGLVGNGTIQIATDANYALILLDEAGEQAAYVQVDDSDAMLMEVYNEELMKLPQTCTLYRESQCR